MSWPSSATRSFLDCLASSSRRRARASSSRMMSKASVNGPKRLPRSIVSGASRFPAATSAAKARSAAKGRAIRRRWKACSARQASGIAAIAPPARRRTRRRARASSPALPSAIRSTPTRWPPTTTSKLEAPARNASRSVSIGLPRDAATAPSPESTVILWKASGARPTAAEASGHERSTARRRSQAATVSGRATGRSTEAHRPRKAAAAAATTAKAALTRAPRRWSRVPTRSGCSAADRGRARSGCADAGCAPTGCRRR